MFGSRVIRIMIAAVMPLLCTGALASSPPAYAQSVQLICGFGGTAALSPGVVPTATSQSVSGSATVGDKQLSGTQCTSQTGITYTGATATFTGSGNFGCASVTAGTETVTIQVQWYIGGTKSDTSTINVSATTNGLVVTSLSVSVHGGQLDGATATAQPVVTILSGDCVTTPVTSVSFVGTVDFIK